MRSTRNSFTIGELARAVGVPTTTLRYYERAGLLKPEARTSNNYRSYSSTSLERLRFILTTAQSAGLTLDDVANLIRLTDERETPCAEVQSILRQCLAEIHQRLQELESVNRPSNPAFTPALRPRGGLYSNID